MVGAGLHVWTDNPVASSSLNKVAEYWAASGGAIPTTVSMSYANNSGVEPGMQIVFDVDSINGNGNDYNILVGESVYGGNWWLTSSSSAAAKAADPSGANNGGNGSEWFGTLGRWEASRQREGDTWVLARVRRARRRRRRLDDLRWHDVHLRRAHPS